MSRNYKEKHEKENFQKDKFPSKGAKKGKSNGSNRNNNKPRGDAELDSRGRDNDPNYYFVSPELASQASQLSFRNILGSGYAIDKAEVPTIAVLALNACPGVSYMVNSSGGSTLINPNTFGQDGINLIDTKLYTLLSTFSGRTSTYMPCDVGIMELAIASVAEFSEHLRRAFGVALTYNTRNRTLPKVLIETMGIDADDLFKNIASYRMRFNTLMTQINQIPLLDNVKYITKSRELYQKIYTDSPSSMAQMYILVPNSVWEIDEATYSSGTILKTVSTYFTSSVANTMGWHLDILESMINKLLTSSTLQVVYADILNLANKMSVPMWQFDYLAENYVVIPEYNANALLQIHHMSPTGAPLTFTTGLNPYAMTAVTSGGTKTIKATPSNNVATDAATGTILYNPLFSNSLYKAFMVNGLVDMPTDSPEKEDIIEALRFTCLWSGDFLYDVDTTNPTAVAFLTLPDHYCVLMNVFKNSGAYADRVGFTSKMIQSATLNAYTVWEYFEAHPLFYFYNSNNECDRILGDVNFWTTVDYNYLVRVNRLMYEGLFDFRVGRK